MWSDHPLDLVRPERKDNKLLRFTVLTVELRHQAITVDYGVTDGTHYGERDNPGLKPA